MKGLMSCRCFVAQPFSEILLKASHRWRDRGWRVCFHSFTAHRHEFSRLCFDLQNWSSVAGVPKWRPFNELMLNDMTTGLDPSPPPRYGNGRNKHIHKVNPRPGSSRYSVLWKEIWPGSSTRQKKERKDDTAWTLPGLMVWTLITYCTDRRLPVCQLGLVYRYKAQRGNGENCNSQRWETVRRAAAAASMWSKTCVIITKIRRTEPVEQGELFKSWHINSSNRIPQNDKTDIHLQEMTVCFPDMDEVDKM